MLPKFRNVQLFIDNLEVQTKAGQSQLTIMKW